MDINWEHPPRTDEELKLFILTIIMTRSDNYAYGILQRWIKKYGNPFDFDCIDESHPMYYYRRLGFYIICNMH